MIENAVRSKTNRDFLDSWVNINSGDHVNRTRLWRYIKRSLSIHRILQRREHPQRVFYIPVTTPIPPIPSNHLRDIQRTVCSEAAIGGLLVTEVERMKVYPTGLSMQVAAERIAVRQAVIPDK